MRSLLVILLLTGCSTVVPVTAKFPEAPEKLMQRCPALTKLNEDAKLSEITKTVTKNYDHYYECSVLVDGWRDWYEIQKRIYQNAGK